MPFQNVRYPAPQYQGKQQIDTTVSWPVCMPSCSRMARLTFFWC